MPGVIIHGTLAPGIADMFPKFFVSHSDHISNGAKGAVVPGIGASVSPLFPPESAINNSSSYTQRVFVARYTVPILGAFYRPYRFRAA
jgi:hypothetical protein